MPRMLLYHDLYLICVLVHIYIIFIFILTNRLIVYIVQDISTDTIIPVNRNVTNSFRGWGRGGRGVP